MFPRFWGSNDKVHHHLPLPWNKISPKTAVTSSTSIWRPWPSAEQPGTHQYLTSGFGLGRKLCEGRCRYGVPSKKMNHHGKQQKCTVNFKSPDRSWMYMNIYIYIWLYIICISKVGWCVFRDQQIVACFVSCESRVIMLILHICPASTSIYFHHLAISTTEHKQQKAIIILKLVQQSCLFFGL